MAAGRRLRGGAALDSQHAKMSAEAEVDVRERETQERQRATEGKRLDSKRPLY